MTHRDTTGAELATPLSRRSLLKASGALVISIGLPISLDTVLAMNAAAAPGAESAVPAKPPLLPNQLSSYIAVNADSTVSAYFGKVDLGQGLVIAIGQIVADELNVPFDRVRVLTGDTATTINQGDASGSTGVQMGGKQMRYAAAEARRILVAMAARKLGAPAETLKVSDGVVSSGTRRLSYAELIGGEYFNVPLAWNGKIGNRLFAPGKGKPKSPTDYTVVGRPIRRQDVAPKVYAQQIYVTDLKLPGMMHGRMIRPPVAGSVPVRVEDASIRGIAGARVVWQKGFLGVVAEREWDAVQAARKLKVVWSQARPPFPDADALYEHIRHAPVRKHEIQGETSGNVDEAFKAAARVIEAEYQWPYQSHASMGPACAVVDIRDGQATCWTGSQKPHFTRLGVAATLGLSPGQVHGIWLLGPGSYGRNDAGDAAMDAAVLAQAVGRPVRVQYTREQATGWDPKAPASIHHARAGVDKSGHVVAYEFNSKAFSRLEVASNESHPRDTLAGQLRGVPLHPEDVFGVPDDSYVFASRRTSWSTIAPLLARASPLRTTHMRDPVGPQIHFASESFMDEVAHALKLDPVEYRLRHLHNPRDVAVIRAVAERAGWERRPSPRPQQRGGTVSGRGIAYVRSRATRVAVVAEVEVERASGRVWARKVTVAHDCGLIVNPDGLRQVIEGNVVQSLSRTLFEEVAFDRGNVTSVDWSTYPILDITDAPETIDIVLLDHPELPSSGAGEPSSRPIPAAIANAVFDATGVRMRRAPLSPARVKAALSSGTAL